MRNRGFARGTRITLFDHLKNLVHFFGASTRATLGLVVLRPQQVNARLEALEEPANNAIVAVRKNRPVEFGGGAQPPDRIVIFDSPDDFSQGRTHSDNLAIGNPLGALR